MHFRAHASPTPLHAVIDEVHTQLGRAATAGQRVIVVLGRSRRMAVEDHHVELKGLVEAHGAVGGEVRKTIGDVATALVVAGCDAGLVVMQASNRASDA